MDPETALTFEERAELSAFVNTKGFATLQKIFGTECEKFKVALLNANPANHAEVLAAHNLAKAAAQFYTAIIKRVNAEVELYNMAPRADDKPVDVTEGILDLGDSPWEEEYDNRIDRS